MIVICFRCNPAGKDSDEVAFNDVVVTVMLNDQPGETAGRTDHDVSSIGAGTTDLIAAGIDADHHLEFGISRQVALRIDAHPVVLDDVVVAKACRAIDLDAFVGKAMHDETLDDAVVGAQGDAVDAAGGGGRGPVQLDDRIA